MVGDHAIAVAMGALISIPTCSLALYMGVLRYRDGYAPARYFVIAWALFLSGVVLYSLQKFGILRTLLGMNISSRLAIWLR